MTLNTTDIALSIAIKKEVKKAIKSRKMIKTEVTDTSVDMFEVDETTDSASGSFVMLSTELPEDLSVGALKLIFKITQELVYGNYLWYFDSENRRNHKAAIAELRRHGIVYKTSSPFIHAVNPLIISKGTPATAAQHTKDCIEERGKVDRSIIIPHRTPPKKRTNPFKK